MNGSPSPLNPTSGSLLGFLMGGGAMTGWELYRAVEETTGHFWNVTRSQVYRELRDLERRRLIVAGEPGPRGRVHYELTSAGRDAFGRWLESGPGPDLIRHHLLLTVFFADHLPADVLSEILRSSLREHERVLDTFRHLKDGMDDSLPGATLTFGIRYEELVVQWIHETLSGLSRRSLAEVDGLASEE